jgi:uncharacterized RDD family membrane protein YckC
VALIASLFARVQILNPHYDEYMKEYEGYTETLKEVIKDENGTEMLENMSYSLAKKSININIISLVVSIVYFVGFQFINKGQTLGKKILKIRMIDNEEGKLKFYQVLLNSAVINNLITSGLTILFVAYMSKVAYLKYSQVLQLVEIGLLLGSLAFMIMRNDGRGLHDLLAKTNVVKEEEK